MLHHFVVVFDFAIVFVFVFDFVFVLVFDFLLVCKNQIFVKNLREGLNEKKRFLSGIARMMGGGSTHARIFWPSF